MARVKHNRFGLMLAQNKESMAIQLKLNELVAAMQGASNRLINVEDLSEDELKVLHAHYSRLETMAKHDYGLTRSHSVEEADTRHARKHKLSSHTAAVAERERQSSSLSPLRDEPSTRPPNPASAR